MQQAEIIEEEVPLTDHKMITMEINFLQFAQGTGYYRCQNLLLDNQTFKAILKLKIVERLRKYATPGPNLQENISAEEATNILMEILQLIPAITQNYERRKHISTCRDMHKIATSIRLVKQEMETNIIRNANLEKELIYLKDALKNLETEVAKEGCRARNVKAQFKCNNSKTDYRKGLP